MEVRALVEGPGVHQRSTARQTLTTESLLERPFGGFALPRLSARVTRSHLRSPRVAGPAAKREERGCGALWSAAAPNEGVRFGGRVADTRVRIVTRVGAFDADLRPGCGSAKIGERASALPSCSPGEARPANRIRWAEVCRRPPQLGSFESIDAGRQASGHPTLPGMACLGVGSSSRTRMRKRHGRAGLGGGVGEGCRAPIAQFCSVSDGHSGG